MTNHPTADLASFCAQLQNEDLSTAIRERVRYLLLDHLAVTLRGSTLPSSIATYQMLEQMAIGSTGIATIFGRKERADASWAALANGVASHGLEMDDVENRSSLHPGVVVFPAALALAEQIGSTPADFYPTVVAGYEVTLRVGAALNPASAYERGFIQPLFAEHWELLLPVRVYYDYQLSKLIWLWGSQAVWQHLQWHIYKKEPGPRDSILVGHVMPGLQQHASQQQAL